MGRHLRGKGSWFGGPGDSSDSGHTALGLTTATPGIAVYNRSTLGGYWLVRAPNGKKRVVRQTDIGPAPWTGRSIDLTYSVLPKFGYSTSNFPTDQGVFKAKYLGKNPNVAKSALSGGGGSSGGGTKTIPGVDRSGDRRALIASYLVGSQNEVAPSVNAKSPVTIANAGDQSGSDIIGLVNSVNSIKDTPSRTVSTGGGSDSGGSTGNSKVDAMLRTARAFDKHHTTYLWGGGHSAFAGPSDRVDCSGYVSAILHSAGLLSAPMTSGQLMNWGHAGKGKYVTVYTNPGHVIINIKGRWFATSGSNPGGGPGEISQPDSGYLSGFTARHPGLA